MFALARAGIREALADGVLFVKLLTLTAPARIEVPAEYVRLGWDYSGRLSGRVIAVAATSEHAYRYMAQAFNRFQTSARRRWDYSYFRVVEEGSLKRYQDAKGRRRLSRPRVHYHLLVMCRAFMPQPEVSRLAARAGLGRIVHITAAESEDDVARYLAKYATKESGQRVPRGLRFYVMSREWAARLRASGKLRSRLEREARTIEGWRFEYVRDEHVAELAERISTTGSAAPTRPPETVEIPPSWLDAVDGEQLELEAAA